MCAAESGTSAWRKCAGKPYVKRFIGVYLLVLVWQDIGELKHITVFDSLIPISNKQSERR